MKVQKFMCDYGDGDRVSYIIFPSGVVMFDCDGDGYVKSRHTAEYVMEEIQFEFVDWIDAPCEEKI